MWHNMTSNYLLTYSLTLGLRLQLYLMSSVQVKQPRSHWDDTTAAGCRLPLRLPVRPCVYLSICLPRICLSNLLAFCVWVSFGHIAYRIASQTLLNTEACALSRQHKQQQWELYAHNELTGATFIKWRVCDCVCLHECAYVYMYVHLHVCLYAHIYVCVCYVEHIPSLWHGGWLTVNVITAKASFNAATYRLCAPLCASSRLL